MPKLSKGHFGPRTSRQEMAVIDARLKRVFKKIKKQCVKARGARMGANLTVGNKHCKRALREYAKIEPIVRQFPYLYAEHLRGDDKAEREWLEAWAAMKKKKG